MGTRLLLGLLAVLLATSFCYSSAESQAERSVFVSGTSECLDCAEKNLKAEHAYQGISAWPFFFFPSFNKAFLLLQKMLVSCNLCSVIFSDCFRGSDKSRNRF